MRLRPLLDRYARALQVAARVRGHCCLTRCTSRAHDAPSWGAARAARDVRRSGSRGGHRPPADLGVSAAELLPVHESISEPFLPHWWLTNHWGYNTIGHFAPHQSYSVAVRCGKPGGQQRDGELSEVPGSVPRALWP